jgi:hypothetical protein
MLADVADGLGSFATDPFSAQGVPMSAVVRKRPNFAAQRNDAMFQ